MAITNFGFSPEPGGSPSVNDNVWIWGQSDIAGTINFKYVIDIFDSIGNQLFRARVYPEVTNGLGFFDVGSIMRNNMTFDWIRDVLRDNGTVYIRQLSSETGEAALKITAMIGEEYYSGVDLISNYQQSQHDLFAWNFVPPLFNRMKTGGGVDKYKFSFLTRRPLSAKYIKNSIEPLFIGVFSHSVNETFTVNTFDDSGNNIGSDNLPMSFSESTFQQLNISPIAVNNSLGYTLIDGSVSYYEITASIFGLNTTFRVNLICPIEGVESVNVYFLNSLGVMETALFELTNKKFMNVARKGYEKRDAIFSDANGGNVFYYANQGANYVQFENKINFDTEANFTMKLQMDFPTDQEFEWLADLFASPVLYISQKTYESTTGLTFYPITIKSTDYEFSKRKYNKLKTFEMEIELNQKRNFNRR